MSLGFGSGEGGMLRGRRGLEGARLKRETVGVTTVVCRRPLGEHMFSSEEALCKRARGLTGEGVDEEEGEEVEVEVAFWAEREVVARESSRGIGWILWRPVRVPDRERVLGATGDTGERA